MVEAGVGMRNRVTVVALATLTAIVLGFTAPEPSTAPIYRLMVLAFVVDLAAARCAAMGLVSFVAASADPGERDLPTAASKTRQEARYYATPLFVRDPSFALPISY